MDNFGFRAITKTSSTAFKAELTGLEDGTTYFWRIVAEGQTSDEATFTTEKIIEVPNLNFDTWTQDGKNWYPNPVAIITRILRLTGQPVMRELLLDWPEDSRLIQLLPTML